MRAVSPSRTHRAVFAKLAGAGAFGLVLLTAPSFSQTPDARPSVISQLPAQPRPVAEDLSTRPFTLHVPQAALDDFRRRIAAMRWPDRETVNDRSQGTQLAKLQELVRYWGTDYDWRKAEAKLNALPQFMTEIDGGPLTEPAARGGRAEDPFDLVLPSMPGYVFSGKPKGTGWNPDRTARAWAVLMRRLGYTRYVAQGVDWGAPISSAIARHAPAGLLGIQLNLPATVPADVAAVLAGGGPAPAGLSEKERAAFAPLDTFYKKYRAYAGGKRSATP